MRGFMRCDMAAFNHFYRNKLKQSMTYQIWNGYFKNVRAILDADPTGNEPLNVDETDEWWLDSEAYRNKNATKNLNNESKPESNLPIVLPLVRKSSRQKLGGVSSHDTANLDYKKTVGRTALMLSCLIEDDVWALNIAQCLLERGASIVDTKDSNGHNALMYAVIYQRVRLLEVFLNLVGDYGLLNKDRFGNNVFHLAALGSNEAICEQLHKSFAKYRNHPMVNQSKNKKGHTPFYLCRSNGHDRCLSTIYQVYHLKLSKETPETSYYSAQKPSVLTHVHFNQSLEQMTESHRGIEQANAGVKELNSSSKQVINENEHSSSYMSEVATGEAVESNYISVASITNGIAPLRVDSPDYSYGMDMKNCDVPKAYKYLSVIKEQLIKHSEMYVDTYHEIVSKNANTYKNNLANYQKIMEGNNHKEFEPHYRYSIVFQSIESNMSKSFRPTNTNVEKLFEKVSAGFLQGKGLALLKQKSTLSEKSIPSRRESIAASSRATKITGGASQVNSQAQSRRTSVIT